MAKRGSSGLSLMIAVDKPKGLTSHDVVNRARRVFGEKRIGHTGTLDPLASGVLCLAIGPATRLDAYMSGHNKTYTMDIAFGCSTTTDDAEGDVLGYSDPPNALFDEAYAKRTIAALVGKGKQLPPVYSAVKVNGQKSYAAARKGNVIDLKPRDFEVFSARLDSLEVVPLGSLFNRTTIGETSAEERPQLPEGFMGEVPVWRVTMEVSGGTYMRSIARDLGKKFGCGAFVSELRRIAIDRLSVSECVSLETLETDPHAGQIDPLELLAIRYAFVRNAQLAAKIDNGNAVPAENLQLNMPLTSVPKNDYCCTTQVFPSAEPCFPGEVVALLVDNRIKALYKFDESKQRFNAACVFPIGVERGSDL